MHDEEANVHQQAHTGLDDHPSLSYGQLVTPHTQDQPLAPPPAPLPLPHASRVDSNSDPLAIGDAVPPRPVQTPQQASPGGPAAGAQGQGAQAGGRSGAPTPPPAARASRPQLFHITVTEPARREAVGMFGITGACPHACLPVCCGQGNWPVVPGCWFAASVLLTTEACTSPVLYRNKAWSATKSICTAV
jgi:hypothetical protein